MNRPATWTHAVALLVLIGAVAARRRRPGAGTAPPPPDVSGLTIVPEAIPARYQYVGPAAASRSVEVRSQVTSVIVERPCAEGTDVAHGTQPVPLEPTT